MSSELFCIQKQCYNELCYKKTGVYFLETLLGFSYEQ